MEMECIVLADWEAQRREVICQVEDLGEEWRCRPAADAAHALALMQERYIWAVLLWPGRGAEELLHPEQVWPLAAPYLLGWGMNAPDGNIAAGVQLADRACRPEALPSLALKHLPETQQLAQSMLRAMGMPPGLGAWRFLPRMTALTAVHPPLLTNLRGRLYPMAGAVCGLSAAAVERSLRLCVESIWSRGNLAVLERFFGSSVDPERGTPTNREFLCCIQERLSLAACRCTRLAIE